MLRRVRRNDRASEAVPDDHKPFQLQRLSDRLDIVDHGQRRVIAVASRIGEPHAAKIEGYRAARRPEMLELRAPLRQVPAVAVNEKDRNRVAAAAVIDVKPTLWTVDEHRLLHMRAGSQKKDGERPLHNVPTRSSMRCLRSSRVSSNRWKRVLSSSSPHDGSSMDQCSMRFAPGQRGQSLAAESHTVTTTLNGWSRKSYAGFDS